jgi:uncharacterized protein
MEISEVCRSVTGGTEVDLLVSPRSNRSGPEGVDEWRKRLVFRVKAPPLDGRANKEVEAIMKEVTGFRSEVVKGQTDRQKTVLVAGPADQVAEKLGERC